MDEGSKINEIIAARASQKQPHPIKYFLAGIISK